MSNKKKASWAVICSRELSALFTSPIPYIVSRLSHEIPTDTFQEGVITVSILYLRQPRFCDLLKASWFVYGKSN